MVRDGSNTAGLWWLRHPLTHVHAYGEAPRIFPRNSSPDMPRWPFRKSFADRKRRQYVCSCATAPAKLAGSWRYAVRARREVRVMNPSPRVHYDAIAHLYDTQPYRAKTVDPDLLA